MLSLTNITYAKKESKLEMTKEVWVLFGHDKVLEEILNGLLSTETGLLANLNKEQSAKVTIIIKDNFAEIRRLMIRHISENASRSELKQMISWGKKPVGKKSLRDFAHARLLFNDMNPSMLQTAPELSSQRQKLMHNFESIYYEYTRRLLMSITDYQYTLYNATLGPEKRQSEKEIKHTLDRLSVEVNQVAKKKLPHIFDRSYRKLSLEEVSVFIKFHKKPYTKAYHKIFYDALEYAIAQVKPKAVLKFASIFEDELAILSPYSKEKISTKKQRELLAILIKQYGKGPIIQAMIEIRSGQITIMHKDEEKEVYGRPNQDLVTIDTLMLDLQRSGSDLRKLYVIIQKKLRK